MNTKTTLKRMGAAVFTCVFALVLACGLAGCAKNDEEEIRSIITASMDMLKNPSEEELAPYIEESDIDLTALEDYGIDFYEFLGNCFKKLDYNIDSIAIDGDEATATLSLTNVDLNAVAEEAATDITSNIGNYTEVLASDNAEQELMKTFMQLLYEKIDASDTLVTNEASLKFAKNDGAWEVDKESVIAMMESMYRGVEI